MASYGLYTLLTTTGTTTGTELTTGNNDQRTFQAVCTGTGAVTATVVIEGSLDKTNWVTIATLSLSGTAPQTSSYEHTSAWTYIRARTSGVTGTSATVNVYVALNRKREERIYDTNVFDFNLKDIGAVGDGVTDDTSTFLAAIGFAEAQATRAALGDVNGSSDIGGNVVITLPPGRFLVTAKEALIRSSFNNKRTGLSFVGAGSPLTEILYNPSTLDGGTPETPLAVNDAWLWLRFRGIKFSCHSDAAGATFMHSNSIQAQQNYTFDDCEWNGSWGRAFYLTGTNNNSEFRFNSCQAFAFKNGPFLESVDSDQFLNYWFDKFLYWSSYYPIIKMTKGGHVSFRDVDVSDWGSGLGVGSAPNECYIAELLGTTHGRGVCHFRVNGLRVEAKNVNAKLLYSQWPQGAISLTGVDYSSQAGALSHAAAFTADAGTDIITHSSIDFPTGTKVRLTNSGGGLPGGTATLTDYYTVRQAAGTSKLAASLSQAVNNQTIDLTTAGTGTHTMTATDYSPLIHVSWVNVSGPTIAIRDSEMAGKILCEFTGNQWDYESSILVDNCLWLENERPSDVVGYKGATNQGGRPNVRFRNCMSGYGYTSAHKPVWDWDSAARTAMGANIAPKAYVVHDANTTITTTQNVRVKMPIGAVITRFQALYKTGSGDSDAATYTLRTSDGSPVTVATVSWSNRNAGTGYTETATAIPFHCDTAAQADLDIVANGDVGSNDGNLGFVIHYL